MIFFLLSGVKSIGIKSFSSQKNLQLIFDEVFLAPKNSLDDEKQKVSKCLGVDNLFCNSLSEINVSRLD